jgi:hypothetical protein
MLRWKLLGLFVAGWTIVAAEVGALAVIVLAIEDLFPGTRRIPLVFAACTFAIVDNLAIRALEASTRRFRATLRAYRIARLFPWRDPLHH